MEKMKAVPTKIFLADVVKLNEFLENKWNIKVAKDFFEILNKKMNLVINHPLIGTPSKFGSRRILVTKHNKLYYRIKGNKVMFLQLFDTRQQPSKNKYE
jgi:plasmid stabilization system protein ParE